MSTHLRNIDHAAVERTAIPETIFRTAQAAVTDWIGKETPSFQRVEERALWVDSPFAAHFVQAVTFAGSVIIPTLDELSGVEVGAAIAFIVDSLTIEHQRTAHSVDIWQAIKGHHVSNDGAHHIRDRRAARYFDNGFVGDDFVDRRCLRRIGPRGLHAAPGRTGSPGDNRAGSGSGTFEFLNKRSTAADANIPCSPSGGLPSTARIYLPLYCVMMSSKTSPRLGSGGSHQSIVIIEGNQGKDDVLRQWVSGADKDSVQQVHSRPWNPYHRNAGFVLQRPGNLWCHSRAPNPSDVAARLQYLRKLRRVTP